MAQFETDLKHNELLQQLWMDVAAYWLKCWLHSHVVTGHATVHEGADKSQVQL